MSDILDRDHASNRRVVPVTDEYQLCWICSRFTGTKSPWSFEFLLTIICSSGGVLGKYHNFMKCTTTDHARLQSYPDLQPLYDACRGYLEIPQRINLLNTRVEVLQDMLSLLKEAVSSRHNERLEKIVIILIGSYSCLLSSSLLTYPLSRYGDIVGYHYHNGRSSLCFVRSVL